MYGSGLDTTPSPVPSERPTEYADRVGAWYSQRVSTDHKKDFAQYLTPVPVADFMAGLIGIDHDSGDDFRILDPGAGTGILACAACEHLASSPIRPQRFLVECFETDTQIAEALKCSLDYLGGWLSRRGITMEFRIIQDDFVLRHAQALKPSAGLFPDMGDCEFDLVICNPPYFKLQKTDPRAKVAADVVHGQPNIYALFMAISAALLRTGGESVFITPRSFASGQYFHRFRERFFRRMVPETIHIFDSRRDAFSRDGILQENVILKSRRVNQGEPVHADSRVIISSSTGSGDLGEARSRQVRLHALLDMDTRDKMLRLPATTRDDAVTRVIDRWPGRLSSYGLQVSTGPVVPFRATELLSGTSGAPLLWLQNIACMRVKWPVTARGKAQYILVSDASAPLLVPDKNYVLLRRFSTKEEKRRLVAAPLLAGELRSSFIGLENHLNFIHRPGDTLSDDEAYGLAALYNSECMDSYFRTLNGSTQVSATELRRIPLPSMESIIQLGRKVRSSMNCRDDIDNLSAVIFSDLIGQESTGARCE